MQKSIDKRLADIESDITRFTKTQGCVFNVLLILYKMSSLVSRSEQAVVLGEVSLESANQIMNRSIVFVFGAMTLMGVSASMAALYFATRNPNFGVLAIACGIFALAASIYAVLQGRRAGGQLRVTRKISAQSGEDLAIAKKKAEALDDKLAQALADWKELIPDDLVSESKSED